MNPGPEAPAPGRRATLLTSCGLAVLALALYGRILGHDFVNIDDHTYVLHNPHLADGLNGDSFAWAFNFGYASNWHPLTWLSHALDVSVFGLSPAGHHLGNLLLHAASSVLVFLVLLGMTSRAGTHAPRSAFVASAAVAVVFAVHPQHVESVAWISERKDALSTLFWLLTMGAYLRYVERPGWQRHSAVTVCMTLGLMAKPMLVTLPFVLWLLDVWPLQRVRFSKLRDGDAWRAWARLGFEKLPWFALIVLSSVATLVAQTRGGAVSSLEGLSLGTRLANSLAALGTYTLTFAWPWPMTVFYPYPVGGPGAGLVAVGALLLLGVTALAARQLARRPWIPIGWFWFLGTLIPVIGLVQVGEQSHADRYTYVPHLGLALLVAFGLAKRGGRNVAIGGGLVAAAWLVMAFLQVGTWKNSQVLWEHALAVTENNHKAHNNLGVFLADAGQLEPAGQHFRAAVEASPGHPESLINYGKYLKRSGGADEARTRWQRFVDQNPDDLRVREELARLLYESGDHAGAIPHFEVLSAARPDDGELQYSLAACRIELDQFQPAIDRFTRAAALGYEPARSHRLIGFCQHRLGRIPEAIQAYRTALDLDPRERNAAFNLGILFEQQQKPDDALAAYRHALTVSPGWFEAQLALGNLLWSRGDPDAVSVLEQAVNLSPDRPEGRYALGRAYHTTGDARRAREQLEALRRLDTDGARRLEQLMRE